MARLMTLLVAAVAVVAAVALVGSILLSQRIEVGEHVGAHMQQGQYATHGGKECQAGSPPTALLPAGERKGEAPASPLSARTRSLSLSADEDSTEQSLQRASSFNEKNEAAHSDDEPQGRAAVPHQPISLTSFDVCSVNRSYSSHVQWCKMAANNNSATMCKAHCLPSVVVLGSSAGGTTFLVQALMRKYKVSEGEQRVRPFGVSEREIYFIASTPREPHMESITAEYFTHLKQRDYTLAMTRFHTKSTCSCDWDNAFHFSAFEEQEVRARNRVVVDKTPHYMYYAHAARELGEIINADDITLVFILRHPVERMLGQIAHHPPERLSETGAFFHFQRQVRQRRCYETCWESHGVNYTEYLRSMVANMHSASRLGSRVPLEQHIEDLKRKCREQCLIGDKKHGYSHYRQYVEKSIYIELILPFIQRFRSDQLLFIISEDLFRRPSREFRKLLVAIGVPVDEESLAALDKAHAINQHASNMDSLVTESEREEMTAFFRPYNALLQDLMGWRLDHWAR